METRSSSNWKVKAGGFDKIKTSLIKYYKPILDQSAVNFQYTTICNNATQIDNKKKYLLNLFTDDYILERYWNNPLKYVNIFKDFGHVMSPDFSLLIGMPEAMQRWQVYRNRVIGSCWKHNGVNIIPTVAWSDSKSFKYCFDGIEKGSNVAVSNIGCRNEEQKTFFDAGYNEMIKVLKPKNIIFQCNKKYRTYYEGQNIVFIDSYWDLKRKKNGG